MSVRQPAQAGRFYPAAPAATRAEVERALAAASPAPGRPLAVMLPHAGWVYCGRVIAETLAGLSLPRQAIVIGPRHTPDGAPRSIAPHRAWALPGDEVPLAGELGAAWQAAAAGEVELVADAATHAREHGVEVLLPFLRALRPDLEVLPVALGGLDEGDALALGSTLARSLAGCEELPLLVISSDMHHFADDATNRELDRIALDALATGDPVQLWREVTGRGITMCGVGPATVVLQALRERVGEELQISERAYATSAEASGDRSRVVGYAGVRIDRRPVG